MDLNERFGAYAAAFEETYADDDWSRLEAYLTEDATYELQGDAPLEGVLVGRGAVIDGLRQSVNDVDRRFDERLVEVTSGPNREGDVVSVEWRWTLKKAGAPDLVTTGAEHATFDGDRIARLVDVFEPGAGKRMSEHMAKVFG